MKQIKKQKTRIDSFSLSSNDVQVIFYGAKISKVGEEINFSSKSIHAKGSPQKIAEMLKLVGGGVNEL